MATLPGLDPFNNLVEPTASAIYYLTRSGADWRLKSYDPSTLAAVIDGMVPGVSGIPRSLVSAGADVLAFATSSGQVFLLRPSLMPITDPTITITGPTALTTLTAESSSITLTGTTADPNGAVVGVAWSTNRGYGGTANGTAAWTAGDIPLLLGTNEITAQATDATGQTSTDTIAVTVPAFTAFLAEGATGTFFDYDMALANPSLSERRRRDQLLHGAGATVTQTVTLPAQSRRTISVDEVPGLAATPMSTSVRTTTAPIVVERTMRWGLAAGPQYGAHTDKATAGAALKWYFAEGSQGFFFTFLLLANPGASANTATVDWLIEGAPAVQRTVRPARPLADHDRRRRRRQRWSDTSFGIVVTFAQPAVAERAMYFGAPPDVLFKAGHDSAGVTAPSTRWFLAEGATGPFFETFILLANPNPAPADGDAAVPDPGRRRGRPARCTIPANGRRTVEHRGAESGGAGAGQRRGGDRRHGDAADRRRARPVLARARPRLVRGAQQLRRDGAGTALGPGRGPRRQPAGHAAGQLPDLRAARQSGHEGRPT